MKIAVNIARFLVGALYIFSGLIKAIDPLGLAYKMQEFFEAWSASGFMPGIMNSLHHYALPFSVIMIALEVLLGLALLIGWNKKLSLTLLLLLTIFFTFLTAYVLFSGKIRACGCFGDCIPLTPIQTFTKDIILLVLIIFLNVYKKYILPVFSSAINTLLMIAGIAGISYLQFYVLKHLPVRDCLPYKKGNNILELRKMPADAVPDEFAYGFIYEKNGEKKEYTADKLPDSTWTYVDRKQTLVKAGKNNVPAINDFSLMDSSNIDVTNDVLGQQNDYYLLFVQNMNDKNNGWKEAFAGLYKRAVEQKASIYVITSDREGVNRYFNVENNYHLPILTSDATAIKTAARANPTLFVMKGAVVQNKYSWADLDKAGR